MNSIYYFIPPYHWPRPREVWRSPRKSSQRPRIPSPALDCRRVWRSVSGHAFGGWPAVTRELARRFPSAWSPTSKPSSSSAPTRGPPTHALQRSQMHTSKTALWTSTMNTLISQYPLHDPHCYPSKQTRSTPQTHSTLRSQSTLFVRIKNNENDLIFKRNRCCQSRPVCTTSLFNQSILCACLLVEQSFNNGTSSCSPTSKWPV